MTNSVAALAQRLNLTAGFPYDPDWSAAPDFLELVVNYVLEHKPQTIVECSSGTSTLMLAQACALNAQGRVYSLENGKPYADKTRHFLAQNNLDSIAQVLDAPLLDTTVAGQIYQWYDLGALPMLSIDMLVIDGPPGFIQKNSRLPALDKLMPYLAKTCVIFLDDAGRDDELATVQQWLQDFPDFEQDYLDLARGCAVLRRE